MIRLGILGSTKGTDLGAIIQAIDTKELKAKISVVVSNQKDAYILQRARMNKIAHYYISHKNEKREIFDQKIDEILLRYNVDLILLIGFMRILSDWFCTKWDEKILNVHPSLLPKYAGGMDKNIYKEVLKNKESKTGCTIHFVTNELDAGPIFVQKQCSIDPEDTIETLKSKVQALEATAFLEAIPMYEKKYIKPQSK
tara:strand:+ start:541 stop:1134 length:594 start_codon:yes stop_codon:yes gene_type:complete